MDVIRNDDFIEWTQWRTKMKQLDIFSYRFLPVCLFPFPALSHDPNTAHSFSFWHLQGGEPFLGQEWKGLVRSWPSQCSLFPEPRPLCSSGAQSREGGNEWADLPFSSPHPTQPLEESKGERKAWGCCCSHLLSYHCGLLQALPTFRCLQGSIRHQGLCQKAHATLKNSLHIILPEKSHRLFLIVTVTTTFHSFLLLFFNVNTVGLCVTPFLRM